MLSKEILKSADFIQCIKTKTFDWISTNYKDWNTEVAFDNDYLSRFTCFSLALQDYVKVAVKQTIAKILYSLEKFSTTTKFFTIENGKSETKKDLSNL